MVREPKDSMKHHQPHNCHAKQAARVIYHPNICILSSSIRSMCWISPGGGGTACVEWVGREFVVTLGCPRLTKPWSIKS